MAELTNLESKLAEVLGNASVSELTEWALPIQERHQRTVVEAALDLAGREDPDDEA